MQLGDNFTGSKGAINGADGVPDTISQINPSATYCFKVTAKPNTVIPATNTDQVFRAWLRVLAIKPTGGTIVLGSDRELLFVVPATGN